MTIERTHDMPLVRSVITHEKIWPMVADDLAGAREDFIPLDHPATCYLSARDGDHLLGIWMLNPENSVTWDVHTCLLPSAWGALAIKAACHAIQWVWDNTPCRRLVTKVPVFNRLALRFARMAGMVEYGRNPRSFLKNGELHDQILLGISKPEVLCQQQ